MYSTLFITPNTRFSVITHNGKKSPCVCVARKVTVMFYCRALINELIVCPQVQTVNVNIYKTMKRTVLTNKVTADRSVRQKLITITFCAPRTHFRGYV